MKCIKSIKKTKTTEVGVVKRVDDIDAESSVKSGYWKYVPKSEYKTQTNKPVDADSTNVITKKVVNKKERKKV